MDECGFVNGEEVSMSVIIDEQAAKDHYIVHLGRQKWVSVLECICADKTTRPPYFNLRVKVSTLTLWEKNFWVTGATATALTAGQTMYITCTSYRIALKKLRLPRPDDGLGYLSGIAMIALVLQICTVLHGAYH
jgi:hypothetical protein